MLPLPLETRQALGLADDAESAADTKNCESRSLLFERYADPELKEKARTSFFERGAKRPCHSERASNWLQFLKTGLKLGVGQLLFAQLQSRLMVNMAGGVMENAGLCLDRFSGLPFIPGSAVKGCARRMALEELRSVANTDLPARPSELASRLVEIARSFGWTDSEWKDGRKRGKNGKSGELHSDFEFAVGEGETWQVVRHLAAGKIAQELRLSLSAKQQEKPWEQLPAFAGGISFLPGWPVRLTSGKVEGLPVKVPEIGSLELDVVTCHHPDYYSRRIPRAIDSEEPIPITFPTVAPGHVFVFAIHVPRPSGKALEIKARRWLAQGLASFGLGAKVAAGYGWFDTTSEIHTAVEKHMQDKAETERKQREADELKKQQQQDEEARRKRKEEIAAATKGMSEEAKVRFTLTDLGEQPFLAKVERWKDISTVEREAIYHLMRAEKKDFWLDIRRKAETGKQREKVRWGHIVQDLFKMAKDRKEKMPS